MGDGGVACAPSQHLMERFPIPEALCGGNGVLTSKSFRSEKKTRHDDKGGQLERKADSGVSEKSLRLDRRAKRGKLDTEEVALERQQGRKGELEEGELQNGELERGELQNGETENVEFSTKKLWKSEAEVADNSRREELEKCFIPDKWSKGRLQRRDYMQDKGNQRAELYKSDYQSARGRKSDLEKVDFFPTKWRRSDREHSPEGNQRSGEASRVDADSRRRSSSKWDGSMHDRDAKKGPRASDIEPGEIRHEDSNGKGFDRDSNSGSWSKWQSLESESSNRKHHSDLSDTLGPRTRRKSEENIQSSLSERSHRHIAPPTSKVSSGIRLSSSRNNDPSLPSRGYHDRQGRSPCSMERTRKERTHHRDHRDRSPRHLDRSPRDRTRHSERDRKQSRSDRSPRQKARHHDHRDRTLGNSERSPYNRGHATDLRESTKRSRSAEKLQRIRFEDRSEGRESSEKDNAKNRSNKSICDDRNVDHKLKKEKLQLSSSRQSCDPPPPPLIPPPPPPILPPSPPPPPLTQGGVSEEPPSMEEDMDISDTPPHDMITSNSYGGKWFYLDEFGEEQGPSKLVDLKRLVDDGFLPSDHIIKHADSDRWVTIENAVSPLVPLNFPSLVSDDVTQMVSPPEAPGNLSVDAGDFCEELASSKCTQQELLLDDSVPVECFKDYHIDERVDALMDGYIIVDGKELETVGEVLNTVFEHADWENWGETEGFTRFQVKPIVQSKNQEAGGFEDYFPKEHSEIGVEATFEKDYAVTGGHFNDYLAGRWSCKGGDWKRIDEVIHDKSYRRKLVLNEGFPLSQMLKSGLEDPRWHIKDEGYYPFCSRKLDLPLWGFSLTEDSSDSINDPSNSSFSGKSGQTKLPPKGAKGTILPVVRINACVLKDEGSPEPRSKVRGTDRHTSRSTRLHSIRDEVEGSSRSKKLHENELQATEHSEPVLNAPKDRVCTVDELSINLGDWYYLDGSGYEHGPSSYLELQELVAKHVILEHSSVFRKNDNTWLPVAKLSMPSEDIHTEEAASVSVGGSSSAANQSALSRENINTFHVSHPQFLGYTRGKLHELVMKSYRNREFATAINEVLDPWIAAKQLKKDMEKNFPFNFSVTKNSAVLAHNLPGDNLWRPDDGLHRAAKRARLLGDESDFDSENDEDVLYSEKNEISFEELSSEVDTFEDNLTNSLKENESWGLFHGRVLARVFHFLKGDIKSLVYSASTCKQWNSAVKFYKSICNHLDFSSIGPKCTNAILQSTMGGSRKEIKSLILARCSNISISVLEEVLQLFPCISYIDITGCNQLKELRGNFPNIRWINRLSSCRSKSNDESHSKIRSLKQITENSYVSRTSRGLSTYLDDSEGLDRFGSQSNWANKIDFSNMQLQQGYYKRAKLLDARKSSQFLSRDAQIRGWMHRKTENTYRKMEVYIANSLKDIMKGNKFDFFIPKVAQIENRLRSGYYRRHGLSSARTDICRMCRDALKAKGRGDSGDMKKILMSFIQLAKRLEYNPSGNSERDETSKFSKDSSDSSSCISAPNHKKRQTKFLSEKKGISKSNTSYGNGGTDYRAYASDREIRRSLSRLKKRDMNSDSETSEDHENDFSEEDGRGEGESSDSDAESDLEIHSRSEAWDFKGEESFKIEVMDDREWGARMTKASLVPPVTRKYEVIDRYIIVADEEEVRKKMRVSLPEDYSEKLLAQKSGTEDMEIPEVKEYKPRKVAGIEVLEQEVYGIDPYTYNLILDSMPDELEWTPADKQKFIEQLILRTLNKQVKHFTGTGNAPMIYPLQPVIEEIQKNAEGGDKRLLKMCHCILKAIRSRPDDNYVSYRKGLGVVCNKEKGFTEDDFIVEFLGEVYPAWKWYEKQDGIRSLQKNSQDPLPEFYNINLERPKGDRDGYDLVIVDAMHKANFASRICHSCRPNCEAKVTAVDGQYQIGIYTLRPIAYGEEITFDYNSVTESKEEHEASVCLCGNQFCKGNYLSFAGEGAFLKILKESHGVLDRHKLMLEACEANCFSQDDYLVLMRAGLGKCLLSGLPHWLVAYSAHLVRFINFERTKLPDVILRHNLEDKRKFSPDICLEVEKYESEIQAEGVYNARLQQIAITLDKVRFVMKCLFGDPMKAPPLVEKLNGEGLVAALWKGDGSLVEDLLLSMAPHVEANLLSDLKSKIRAHDPSGSDDIQNKLRKSLLWLRDELRNLPSTNKCRHDAAADVIHMYAYTKLFFKIHVYKTVKSSPVYISPLDLGPKYAEKMGSGFQEYCKVYGENYCLGQLIYWHCQTNIDPDCRLARARKGCLLLPDVTSFYSKSQKPLREYVYGSRTLRLLLSRMEKQPQRPWPKDRIWGFKSNPAIFGSPMLDSVINKCPLDKEMMHWLKTRPSVS